MEKKTLGKCSPTLRPGVKLASSYNRRKPVRPQDLSQPDDHGTFLAPGHSLTIPGREGASGKSEGYGNTRGSPRAGKSRTDRRAGFKVTLDGIEPNGPNCRGRKRIGAQSLSDVYTRMLQLLPYNKAGHSRLFPEQCRRSQEN